MLEETKKDKSEAGRKGRARGRLFELKVRKDLEKNGWVVAKWVNNVEFSTDNNKEIVATLIPAKRKYNPFTKFTSFGNGFPDFIAYKKSENSSLYEVIGVEVKSNGYLDREERSRCLWLIKNNIFGKILVAKKGKKRGEIVYSEFDMRSS